MSDRGGSAPGRWIGVASRDHVRAGVAGGFCQLGHGKAGPLRRLGPGDWLIYYSPRETIRTGDAVQAFTAIGEVVDDLVIEADMGGGLRPWRRAIRYAAAQDAPIRPLLARLSFTRDRPNWGYGFRRGFFGVPEADFHLIAKAMGVEPKAGAGEA